MNGEKLRENLKPLENVTTQNSAIKKTLGNYTSTCFGLFFPFGQQQHKCVIGNEFKLQY